MRIKIQCQIGESLKTFEYSHRFPISIGRNSDCELRIPDQPQFRTVSRCHADIFVMQKAFHLRNVSKKNVIYLNNQRLAPNKEAPLRIGDKFKLGSIEILVEDIEAEGKHRHKVTCPNGHKIEFSVDFCPYCGADMTSGPTDL